MALQESEAQFRAIFETNQACEAHHRLADGSIVEANPAAVRFYGWEPGGAPGEADPGHQHGPSEQVQAEMALAGAARKQVFQFTHRLASGQLRQVESSRAPLRPPDRPLLVSIIHDVTARVAAEAELQQLAADLSRAQEIGAFGNWRVVFGSEGETWSCSEGLRRIFGLAPGQPITRQSGIGPRHPEDQAKAQAAWQAALAAPDPCSGSIASCWTGRCGGVAITVQFQHSEAVSSSKPPASCRTSPSGSRWNWRSKSSSTSCSLQSRPKKERTKRRRTGAHVASWFQRSWHHFASRSSRTDRRTS